jgi:pantoate--beta-alanine ligase
MEVIKKKEEIRRVAVDARAAGETVGLVPTMGFFHEGHLQLMRRARSECDVVVVSLFVNPTQFCAGEDLESYPRDFDRDGGLAEAEGVDYIFAPEVEEMYPEGSATFVEVERLSGAMCGRSRPEHFRGVATVVAKLFNIVPAQRAYFGQKDAQQLVIVKRMAADLDFGIEIVPVPTVREPDGLAMSSRNMYLLPEEREQAVALFRSLEEARRLIESGERRPGAVLTAMQAVFYAYPLVNLEYISICDNIFLKPLEELSGEVLVAVAVRLGRARLIDNMLFTT